MRVVPVVLVVQVLVARVVLAAVAGRQAVALRAVERVRSGRRPVLVPAPSTFQADECAY